MKKASKILTLILVVVFLFGIFAGCGLVGRDVAKYRGATVITVGNQQITVGKLLDTFNSYYNQYYYMIAYGNWTTEDVLELAIRSLISQYMKVDAYAIPANEAKPAPKHASDFANAKYLNDEQLDYSISYVKYLIFSSFDSNVLEKIESKYDLKDVETEDTSRDFYEYDDLKGAATYSEYYRDQNFTNEDMDEYIEKYYDSDVAANFADPSFDLLALYLESAEKMVEELNGRLDKDEDDDTEITVEEYQKYQRAIYNQYKSNVKNSYSMSFDAFVKRQTEDMIMSGIIALYNYGIYKEIELDDEKEMNKVLESNYQTLKAAKATEFKINKNYESFIEGLTDNSVIYDVPSDYANDYVFVKNILIPFTSEQTTKLASLEADLGTDDSDVYRNYRNLLATQIVADDFNSEKDDDGKYQKIENLFALEGGKVVINTAAENKALSDYLKADGSVTAMEGKDKLDTIIELMKRFNTDTAQHSSLYSYVVRVGDDIPKSYTHRWVDEFVAATNDAMERGGEGNYGIGISDYGVHIVYVQGYIKADVLDFSGTKYLDTKTAEYRMFKTYFEKQASLRISDDLEAMQKQYLENDKIATTDIFKKFLKTNKMDFDLLERLNSED